MKRFIFRLESVLKLRANREQKALEGYGAAVRALTATQQDLARAERALEACFESARAATRTCGCVWQFTGPREYSRVLEKQKEALRQECVRLETAAQQALKNLKLARQKREVLENLKAKREQAHQAEAARQFQAQLDDRASAMYAAGLAPENHLV
jgi:flagellar export protein FliJ